ncbi:hypothetical protein Peur_050605 [Populus x canadensis]
MNVLSFSSGKNLKEGLVTLEEDLVKLTDELQMEAQCIPNMLIHMLRLEWKIVQCIIHLQVYSIKDSDQCLIGTAEIPVGGIHMDAILAESLLPLKCKVSHINTPFFMVGFLHSGISVFIFSSHVLAICQIIYSRPCYFCYIIVDNSNPVLSTV